MPTEIGLLTKFNLMELPYVLLGLPWSREDESIYFVEDNCMFQEVLGDVIKEEDNMTCLY